MSGRLQNKVAIITGGASGIGLASAERFVAEGAKVVIADINDAAGRQIESRYHGELRYVHCDVAIDAEVEALVAAAVAHFGRLDIMFNNAGIQGDRDRKRVVSGKSVSVRVDIGGRRIIKTKKHNNQYNPHNR